MLQNIKIGTCGFGRAKRPEYVTILPVVEIQHTFYDPPQIKTLEKWRADVPDDFPLSDKQRKQVAAAKSGATVVERDEIMKRMDTWEYPLHFLDYETFSYAIPQFDGVRPFQQMCFQYSLHTIDSPGGQVRHSGEYLARNGEPNPPLKMAESLKKAMSGGIGTVFVWYEAFEKTRNTEMAAMFP